MKKLSKNNRRIWREHQNYKLVKEGLKNLSQFMKKIYL